jgi:hypothetical protein
MEFECQSDVRRGHGSTVALLRIAERLSRPLGRCTICRTREADRLLPEFRSGEYVAECAECARTSSTRQSRREIQAVEASLVEIELDLLEANLHRYLR